MAAAKNSDYVLDDGLDEDEDILAYHTEQQAAASATAAAAESDNYPDDEDTPTSNLPSPDSDPPHSFDYTNPTTNSTNVKQASNAGTTSTETTTGNSTKNPNASTSAAGAVATPSATPSLHESDSVIIDGLPLTTSRTDLFRLLAVSSDDVSNVRLRRLDEYSMLRVRVQFVTSTLAAAARGLDGTDWNGSALSVKPASEERWAASVMPSDADSGATTKTPKSSSASTANKSSISGTTSNKGGGAGNGFWAAFGAARAVAEQLEQRARALGDDLEHRLNMSERLEAGRQRVVEVDRSLKVTERVDEFTRAGFNTAEQVDREWGISDGVGAVMDNVGAAARKVAREVDENFRVTDKAREAANAALSSPTVSRVAKSIVSTLDGNTGGASGGSRSRVSGDGAADGQTPTRRKKYPPRSQEHDPSAGAVSSPAAAGNQPQSPVPAKETAGGGDAA